MTNIVKRAIFLDRDGVLNKKRDDYVKSLEELEVLPNAGKHLALLQKRGFALIIISNQSAVNRGLLTYRMLETINGMLVKELLKDGCTIDAVYICPHKPDEYCNCRKPAPGLLQKATMDLDIDLSRSWIIGDSDIDIEAGAKLGCKGIKIQTNSDLRNAVDAILSQEVPM